MPPSEITGIHQSDVVIVSGIQAMLQDVRANPWLLDYAFASLPQDFLTREQIGHRAIENAKKWFLSTKVPVFPSAKAPDDPEFPCITVGILTSNEAETTLADTHYVVHQDDSRLWPALTSPFTPSKYSPQTGVLQVPESVTKELVIVPEMVIVDTAGRVHPILNVTGDDTLTLAAGTVANFTDAVIKGKSPAQVVYLKSVSMKENYTVGSHVQGEPTHLVYLHTIVVFCLFRYKKRLLEGRGFERSEISSSEFRRNEFFDIENVYSRHVNISGFVRQSWPEDIEPKIASTTGQPRVLGAKGLPPDTSANDALWTGEQDVTMGKKI